MAKACWPTRGAGSLNVWFVNGACCVLYFVTNFLVL